MKRYFILLAAAIAFTSAAAHAYVPFCTGQCMTQQQLTFNDRWVPIPVQDKTTTVQTSAPVTATTTVSGGDLAAQFIEWLKIAFGTIIAGLFSLLIVKIRAYFGLITTDAQKAALQAIAVNGVNSAALKAETALRDNPNLTFNVKDAVVADAVSYVQAHGADTIKALGLDANSGDAVDAIKARVATAMNGKETPTVTATAVIPAAA